MTEPVLQTFGLRRTFGDVVAVDGIDLTVGRGSFYGFLGPNGAGKSTTIKCLTGLIRPSAGRMEILGLDPQRDPAGVKQQVGVVPEDLALFDRLTGSETLRFVGSAYRLTRATATERADELLALMDLADVSGTLVADYSHGMRKKLALAAALLPAPKLLFLDEPFTGIDAVASREVRSLLQSFVGNGGTIFLTSHILEIVERLCDHIGVIHRGRIVAQGPIDDLRSSGGEHADLERVFLDLVGAEANETPALNWLHG